MDQTHPVRSHQMTDSGSKVAKNGDDWAGVVELHIYIYVFIYDSVFAKFDIMWVGMNLLYHRSNSKIM